MSGIADVVHVHSLDRIVPWIKRLHGKPVVMHYHGTDIEGRWEERRSRWSRADFIAVSTPNLLEGGPPSAIYVPNPVDTSIFKPLGVKRDPRSAVSFRYGMDAEAEEAARRLGLTLTWLDRWSVQHGKMPEVLSRYEYYIDMRKPPTHVVARSVGKAALEALVCFPPGEMVSSENGCTPIQSVQPGATIIGAGGQISTVLRTLQRTYEGALITLKGMGLLPVEMTPEHPVLVATSSKKYIRYGSEGKFRLARQIGEPSWVHAGGIRIGDYLALPKFKVPEARPAPITLDYARRSLPSNKLVTALEVTNDVMELFGYYLAEGSCGAAVHLDFGSHETELVSRVYELASETFPYTVTESQTGSGVRVAFGGCALSRFIHNEFGTQAWNKRIPIWIMTSPLPLLKSFLGAYMRGDGCVADNGDFKRGIMSTVSRGLALQLQIAFSRLGILPTLCRQERGEGEICGRRVKQRPRYLITLGDAKLAEFLCMQRRARRVLRFYLEDANNFYLPVTHVSTRLYSGTVYNLQTSTNDYVVSNIGVHNCGCKVVDWSGNIISGLPPDNEPVSVAAKWNEVYLRLLRR
jgi:hypothetical protein